MAKSLGLSLRMELTKLGCEGAYKGGLMEEFTWKHCKGWPKCLTGESLEGFFLVLRTYVSTYNRYLDYRTGL